VLQTRGLYTNDEGGVGWGVHFYGSKGYLSINANGRYKLFLGGNKEPERDPGKLDDVDHYRNFIEAVRADKPEMLSAEITETVLSCDICHLGNIAYRMQRKLRFDPQRERFIGDAEADQLLSREYRKPYVVSENV